VFYSAVGIGLLIAVYRITRMHQLLEKSANSNGGMSACSGLYHLAQTKLPALPAACSVRTWVNEIFTFYFSQDI